MEKLCFDLKYRNLDPLQHVILRTEFLPVFSPNAGKYEPQKLRIRTLFTQCQIHTKWWIRFVSITVQKLVNLFAVLNVYYF